jgi:hypothetical protein
MRRLIGFGWHLCIVGLGFSSRALEVSIVLLNGLRLYLHFLGHFGYVALVIVTHDLAFIVVVKKNINLYVS